MHESRLTEGNNTPIRVLLEEQARRHQAELAHVSRLSTVGEMASGLAHELNQPLCAIQSRADLCLRALDCRSQNNDKVKENLQTIEGQAERAGNVIRRIKAFVKKREPNRSTVNISSVVRETLAFVNSEIRNNNVKVSLELSEQIPMVLADRVQIEQVLLNLIRNAVDAMAETEQEKRGRHTGSYDLEIGADLQQLLGIEGGSLLVHTEGSWSRTDVDETSVGSVFGINADAGGRRAMDVTELWYEQAMFDDTLRLRFGKMDIGGGFECRGCPVSFDGSAYANDETSQFLNGALVNNPTIPMPDMGLGAVLYWNPIEWWYASIGAIDAQADARESGFRTAFHGEDNFFYAAETGVAPVLDSGKGPMPGAYRIGIWNDPQAKERFSDGEMQRDDTGIYISADQMVYKENNGPEDSQGFGVFTRYGMADKKVNDIADFWSFGMQYQGLLEGRDDDVLGLGYAKGIFSTEAGYSEVYESVVELYYSAQIAPWVAISPSVQFVDNPGGDNTVDDAVVFGLRAQSSF